MEGQLNEHSLAELISEILAKRLSGALRVGRERVKAVVYFDAGELIYAASNLRHLRLAEYLKKRGLASPAPAADDSASDFAIADALISRGLLTPAVLNELRSEQVVDVLRVPLLWTSGQWSFDSQTRLSVPVRVRIEIKQLLVDAARRMDLQFAHSRFRNPNEVISPVIEAGNKINLSATEGFLRSRVEEPITVEKLVALSGQREPDAHRTIFGLVLAGVLQRELWPHTFRASEPDLKPGPSAAPVVRPNAPARKLPEVARDPQKELMEFLDRLAQATTHYEVLDVSPTADAGQAKLAYYALARRFHPDRFHDLARTPLHARLESAFARVTQAHETLANPDLRATYDVKIEALKRGGAKVAAPSADQYARPTPAWDDASGNGSDDLQSVEKRFKEGLAALQLGQINVAITTLSIAARLAPKQPRYRAYYGRALAGRQQTQRLAEVELQAAVTLDPGNASYRVMLAELYRDLGFSRRAIAELKRAVSLDSGNAEARQMLQTLEAKK
jgi:curved DNA-binding protein CbpA